MTFGRSIDCVRFSSKEQLSLVVYAGEEIVKGLMCQSKWTFSCIKIRFNVMH